MRKIIMIIAALMVSANLFADAKSEELLRALQKKVDTFGDYRVDFKVTVDGQSMEGRYEVSGNSYHIRTEDVEVFCDGTTRWEVNVPDEEILIDRVDPNDRTILGNPTRMFDFLDGSYTHNYVGKATLKDGEADKIELTETIGDEEDKLAVYLNSATGLPSRISYFLDNLNTDAVVDIQRITPRVTLDRETFKFDPARYEGFEMIDFR